jgi:hypothetical protein
MAKRVRKAKPARLNAIANAVNKNKHEGAFLKYWELMFPNLPQPKRDYKHIPGRRFALDMAWPALKIGAELHGGGGRSRHASVEGMAADCEKNNLGIVHGWRVLTFNVVQLKDMHVVVQTVAELVQSAMLDRAA